jgi:hypothetical protein
MIKIYEVGYSEEILQTSYYGTTSLSYRIDAIGQFYITNFKTLKTPANYIAEVYLSETLLGSIQFRTVSP